jgi:hypothetical protein
MSISGTTSFWQQDQNYWNQSQWDSSISATNSLNNAIASAETNLGKGLAAIANKTALNRVNSQLIAGIQSVLGGTTGSSSTSSGASTAAASTPPVPATATGKVSLSLSTTLVTLGVPAGGSIVISAGGNATTYASTGSDTIGDLLNAVNVDLPTNAQVNASLNSRGDLVLTSKNTTDTISIGGIYASNFGFAVGNQTFKPTPGSTAPAAASTTAASTASSTASTASSSTSSAAVPTYASLIASSAASLLADSGASGSLVDMLT